MPFSVRSWDVNNPRSERLDIVDVETEDAAHTWALDNAGFGRAYVVRPVVERDLVVAAEADLPLLDSAPDDPVAPEVPADAPVAKRSRKRSNDDD
jgi:hypothetical protein